MSEVSFGDVVQIVDREHHWFPALIVVTDVRSWGVQGYTVLVDNTDHANGLAFIRLKQGSYSRVGPSPVIMKLQEEEDQT